MTVFFALMFIMAYGVTPFLILLGWVRWAKCSQAKDTFAVLSSLGFLLATASALLAGGSITYAQLVRGFPYHDPLLAKIYHWGFLLSLAGLVFGLCGSFRHSTLRLFGVVSPFGTLVLWTVLAAGE